MESRLIYAAFLFLIIPVQFSFPQQTNEFIKPKKKALPKIKPEDCCAGVVPLLKQSGQLLQEIGIMQVEIADIVDQMIDNDKNAALKKASQEELHEFIALKNTVADSMKMLKDDVQRFNHFCRRLRYRS